jgi:hypothetical protein
MLCRIAWQCTAILVAQTSVCAHFVFANRSEHRLMVRLRSPQEPVLQDPIILVRREKYG